MVSSSVPSRSKAIASTLNCRVTCESGGITKRSSTREASRADARKMGAHCRDRRRIVGLPEDRAARDERVGAGLRDVSDVVFLHTAIDLEQYFATATLHRCV